MVTTIGRLSSGFAGRGKKREDKAQTASLVRATCKIRAARILPHIIPIPTGPFRRGDKAGQFFCAYVGERLFLRFVPADGSAIVRDTLGCLRLITCTKDTQRLEMKGVPLDTYTAWQTARHDIFTEWALATDPANLQPKVRPALKAAGDHLRKYPPPDLNQDEVNALIDSIEAPWGTHIEKQIREASESMAGIDASKAIFETVRRLGLEPFRAPEPLPPIESEVRLVCWMVVE